MYGLYSRAASNQERPMMARVRYVFILFCSFIFELLFLPSVNATNGGLDGVCTVWDVESRRVVIQLRTSNLMPDE